MRRKNGPPTEESLFNGEKLILVSVEKRGLNWVHAHLVDDLGFRYSICPGAIVRWIGAHSDRFGLLRSNFRLRIFDLLTFGILTNCDLVSIQVGRGSCWVHCYPFSNALVVQALASRGASFPGRGCRMPWKVTSPLVSCFSLRTNLVGVLNL